MKRILIYLSAITLVAGAASLRAQETTNSPSTSPTPGAGHQLSAADRQERKLAMERMGLTREELKDLSPEDRRAKIKEAATKTVEQLEAKKASSGLTTQEQTDLTFIKNHILGQHHKPAVTN